MHLGHPAIFAAASATAQPLPATSRCTSPSFAAAVTALSVASLHAALSCSTQTSALTMLRDPQFLELADQRVDIRHLHARLPHGSSATFTTLRRGATST
jgi:hypothetical protein